MGKDSLHSGVHVQTCVAEGSHAPPSEIGNSSLDSTFPRPELQRSLSRISTSAPIVYKVYKRRFFGLGQLILLNLVISWDWTIFAPISDKAARYFNTTESAINWLATAYFFAFVAATPFTLYALGKRGPKTSIVIGATLTLVGNWIKYGGVKSNRYSVVMFGQILIGGAQTFVLSTPATYSNIWFSGDGRTSATAIASLANPFGAALGQLISPMWVSDASQVPNAVLYTSIIASVASLPAFFIPAKPPTPPTPATISNSIRTNSLKGELKTAFTSLEFYLLFIPFSVYVGFFNSFSSVLNQILRPYGFSDDDAGIAGAVLILVGLVSAAISSPLIDKYKFYLWYIRIVVPVLGLMYLVFVWAPPTKSIPYVYFICAMLGAASFGLVPVVMEYLAEILYPIGPETPSTLCWAGGLFLGGVFVIIMDALETNDGGPDHNMHRGLIFQAVIAMVVMPLPVALGFFGRSPHVRMKRFEAEQRARFDIDDENEDDEVRVLPREDNGQLRI